MIALGNPDLFLFLYIMIEQMKFTSVKPNVSVAKRSSTEMRRPLSKRLQRQAQQLVRRYRFLVEPEGSRFTARPMEYPEVVGVGKSPEVALQQAVALATTAVAVLLEARRTPPLPRNAS